MGLAFEYRLHSHGGGNVGVNIKQLIVQGRIDSYVDGVVVPIDLSHAFQRYRIRGNGLLLHREAVIVERLYVGENGEAIERTINELDDWWIKRTKE